jgi:hypothetical protein
MLNKIGILLGSSLFMSHLLFAQPLTPPVTQAVDILEPLQAVQFFEQHLMIKVKSNGCTKASHFKIETQQNDDAIQVSIHRQKADQCRAMPRIVEITLPFTATANSQYYIANPWIFM